MNRTAPATESLARRAISRTGFTLLELVLSLAVLATIAAIAWPHLQPGLSRAAYKSAALQLKSDFAAAREQSIHDGRIREFRMKPGSGRYLLSPAGGTAPQRRRDSRAGSSTANDEQDAEEALRELPGDMRFLPPFDPRARSSQMLRTRPVADERTRTVPEENTRPERLEDVLNSDSGEWVLAARFFPDGRATESRLELEGPDDGRLIAVQVRGLTGGVTIGPVIAADPEPSRDAAGSARPPSASGARPLP